MAGRAQTGRTEDRREIAHFSQLAGGWWDEEGPFAPLHRLNPLRLAYIRERAAALKGLDLSRGRVFAGLSVLDVGCGGGLLCEPLARAGAAVTGVDASAAAIEAARAHAAEKNLAIDYRAQSVEQLAQEAGRFDVILNMEVVEHVANMPDFVRLCAGLLKPEGVMVVATINRTLKAFIFAIIGAEYILGLLPRGTHHYEKLVRPEDLRAALRSGGVAVRDETGVAYNPVTGVFRLTEDMSVNYMLIGQKRAGRSGEAGAG